MKWIVWRICWPRPTTAMLRVSPGLARPCARCRGRFHQRPRPIVRDAAWHYPPQRVPHRPDRATHGRLQPALGLTPPPSDLRGSMKRVTGIGGIFFKAKDAPALQAWYKRHLGIDVQPWGGTAFTWTDDEGKPVGGTTIWSIGPAQSDQFAPSTATFRITDSRSSAVQRRG